MREKIIVEHTGSVKIDNSEYVNRFLLNARKALNMQDWEEVEKYYNLVEQNTPYNMEAVFFSSYGKAMLSLYDNEFNKRQQRFEVLIRSVSVLDSYYELTNENKEAVLRKISYYIEMMYTVRFTYNPSAVGGNSAVTVNLMNAVRAAFLTELRQIAAAHREPFIMELIQRNSAYHPRPVQTGGCYIATAVYGSYDCPQVWGLRRYRDYGLAETQAGRALIRLYYRISPKLVKRLGSAELFRRWGRKCLDRVVGRLMKRGIKDTPYADRIW